MNTNNETDAEPSSAADHTIWTLGHWTCPKEVVLEALASAKITLVADVRKLPGSRRSPQFNEDELVGWLEEAGIAYRHLTDLAGRRPKQRDIDPNINAGWQNTSFKNYADYTLTEGFQRGMDELLALAETYRIALLCGEPMPWRCHRSLIANELVHRGWQVVHLTANGRPREHQLGQWGAAPVVDASGRLTYPVGADDR